MPKPSNIGVYHQGLDYPDENPFRKAYRESAERSKNLAEEAFDKKKSKFLDDFWIRLNEEFMPDPNASPIVLNAATGERELDKKYLDFDKLTPMQIFRRAQEEARAEGLPAHAIKLSDIKNQTLANLHTESVTERYKQLDEWRRNNSTDALNAILEDTEGWDSYYARNTDPYAAEPLYGGGKYKVSNKDRPRYYNKMDKKYIDAVNKGKSGWKLDAKGRVVDIPWLIDYGEPTAVKWDEKGAYVEGSPWGSGISDALIHENWDSTGLGSKIYLPGFGSELHDWDWQDDFHGYNKEQAKNMLYTAYHKDLDVEW